MAIVRFSAYTISSVIPIKDQATGKETKLVSFKLQLNGSPQFPDEKIEASRLVDVEAAFEKYKAKAAASGLPLHLTARVVAGRKPSGFDKAGLGADVNV